MAWLTDARIDNARELLETTTEPIERIGRLTGLGNPASVRAVFHRRVGTSPQEYRTLFRQKVNGEVPLVSSRRGHTDMDHLQQRECAAATGGHLR